MTSPLDELRDGVAAALAAHDKEAAVRVAVDAVDSGAVDVPTLYRDVLVPILAETGAAWQTGERRIWQEHLATATVRTIVELLYLKVAEAKRHAPPSGRSVLLACPPEEAHELGLRMIADRFDMAGWTTHFLGADTPPEEIADAAKTLRVDAVALSSSTHFHRLATRHFVDELKRELPGVAVWVGGPAFFHDREGWGEDELLDLEAVLGDGAGGRPSEGEKAE